MKFSRSKISKPSIRSVRQASTQRYYLKNTASSMAFVFGRVLCSLVAVLQFGAAFAAVTSTSTCEADHQCAPKSFCYAETGECVQCKVCEVYNRQPSAVSSCAKDGQDCGNCLQGYKTQDLNDKSHRCVEAVTEQPKDGGNGTATYWTPAYSVVAGCCVLLAVSSGIYSGIYYNRKGRLPVQVSDVESGRPGCPEAPLLPPPSPSSGPAVCVPDRDRPPPPYSQRRPADAAKPSAPPLAEPRVSAVSFRLQQRAEETLLQAVPFHVPADATYSLPEDDVAEEQDPESHDYNLSPTPVFPEDDDSTQPSNWVPDNFEPHNDQPCDDSGVSAGSSTGLDLSTGQPTVPLTFRGLFDRGGGAEPRARSPGPGERPAKRRRGDSGSHSAESSSDDDDEPGLPGQVPPPGQLTNLTFINVNINNSF